MTKSHNIEEFLEVLSSSSPTPGGGGASALVGAIGVSLGHMVGALTSGKKKYEHVQGEIDLLLKHADDLSKSLTGLPSKGRRCLCPSSKVLFIAKRDTW